MASVASRGGAAERPDGLEGGLTGLEASQPSQAVVLMPVNPGLLSVVDDLSRRTVALWSRVPASDLARDGPDAVICAPADPAAASEAVSALRAHWKDQLVPLVLLLPRLDETVAAAAYRQGVDFVWAAGESFPLLEARVESLLRLRTVVSLLMKSRDRAKGRVRDHEAWARFLIHDLRSPLAALAMGLDSLRATQAMAAEDVAFCDQLLFVARRASGLVSSLLDHERLTDGRLVPQRQPTDLAALAERVVAAFQPVALDRRVDLRVTIRSPREPVLADPALLERVLENLLGNALRCSPGKRPVDVEIERRDQWMCLEVLNHGAPIPVEMRERIFEPYMQLGSSGEAGSAGLGLAFCRAVLSAHGGEILATDRDDRVCFLVALPL